VRVQGYLRYQFSVERNITIIGFERI